MFNKFSPEEKREYQRLKSLAEPTDKERNAIELYTSTKANYIMIPIIIIVFAAMTVLSLTRTSGSLAIFAIVFGIGAAIKSFLDANKWYKRWKQYFDGIK